MKEIVLAITLLVVTNSASAAHYYRFWQGWKLDDLTYEEFRQALEQKFVPATVELGAQKGLISYLPMLPPPPSDRPDDFKSILPDEIALVVYDTEENYRVLRSTPEGQAYGNLHWDYFDRDKGSKSSVPDEYEGSLEVGYSYDVLQSDADWQSAYAVAGISRIQSDLIDYVDAMKARFSKTELESFLILVMDQYIIEYQLWKDRRTFQQALVEIAKIQDGRVDPVNGAYGPARVSSPYDSGFRFKETLNVKFDIQ